MQKVVIPGYKVFDKDWKCIDKQYSCPGVFVENIVPAVGIRGMHFCLTLQDCFLFKRFTPNCHVAEINACGTVVHNRNELVYATNKLEIIREVPWYEVLEKLNKGYDNSGRGNIGNYNAGSGNIGSMNAGDHNEGDGNKGHCNRGNGNVGYNNIGNCNTGSWNIGSYNSGSWNIGHKNSGYYNRGNCNSGHFNIIDSSAGCFMTKPGIPSCDEAGNLYFFNKPSEWTRLYWRTSDAWYILQTMFNPNSRIHWVNDDEMSLEQKLKNPEHVYTRGAFIDPQITIQQSNQKWWEYLSEEEQSTIMQIPNFDKEIFKEITYIDVDKKG